MPQFPHLQYGDYATEPLYFVEARINRMKAFRSMPSKKLVLNKYSCLQLFYNEAQEKPSHSIRNRKVLPNAQRDSYKAETLSPS